jgi:hypothetical protein
MATQLPTTTAADEQLAQLPALTSEGERFALRQRQARMFAMSPLVPDHLRKGTAEQAIANCWIALTLAEAMGEVPLIVMQNIHVVNGKAGFASQYMIARANSSGIFKGRIDWRIDRSDPANLSVTAYAVLRETGQEVSVTCDMKMAKAEQWTKNNKYTTMPEVMLRYRSAAFLVRFYAPDVMLGYQTAEEVEDVALAAAPSGPPLTAKMLIDQSGPAPAQVDDLPAHDATTGELMDDEPAATDDAPQGDNQGGDQGQQEAEQPATLLDAVEQGQAAQEPGDDPAAAKANEIIDELKAALAVMDVNSIMSRAKVHMEAMPTDLADSIERIAEARKEEIKVAQDQTRAKEAAE